MEWAIKVYYMLTSTEESGSFERQMNLTNLQLLQRVHGLQQTVSSELPVSFSHPSVFPSSFTLIKTQQISLTVTLADLSHLNFPSLQYSVDDLVGFSVQMLRSNSFGRKCLSAQHLRLLVKKFAESYLPIAYHNFTHAFTLTQLNYHCLSEQKSLSQMYNDEETFYILVAGLAHDLAHPGTNNQFHTRTNSSLAQMAKDQPVLQMMHLRKMWELLAENEEINFLSSCSQPSKAKHIITRLILNTDMARHEKNLTTLKNLRESDQFQPHQISEQKWILMEQIFHACDIGNPCQKYQSYISWAALLSHEFNQQTKLQVSLGLDPTPPFVYSGLSGLYRDQIWFLGCIVQPLWREIVLVCPNLHTCTDNLERNLRRVSQQLEQAKL